jgi:hypothetical protein
MTLAFLARLRKNLPLLLLCCALLPAVVQAQGADEYAAKAAFIYNIAQFSSLPNMNGVVRLCVLGRDPFGSALATLEGKPLANARLTILYPRSGPEALMQCHILYISASEADDMAALADGARAAGVLTIADTRGAARKGVMLELYLDDRRIAFEFNGTVARGAGVGLSSKVLRLARAIY